MQRKVRMAVKLDINSYPALLVHGVGCDFDKKTVEVSGVRWVSF